MHKFFSCSAAIVLMAASSLAWSQAEIVDSQPIGGTKPSTNTRQTSAPVSGGMDISQFYYQLQMLQQEVQQLRGMVDEQAHEIRRLKQQQLDDYVDLDRRLSELSKAGAGVSAPSSATPFVAASGAGAVVAGSVVQGESELAAYDKAVRMIIKDKQLDEGAEAMQAYIDAYPQGVYVGNAQYWLGQVYFVQGQLPEARKWFSALLESHPSSQKAPEAKYKLGEIMHQMGDDTQARRLLQEVAEGNSSVARLAQEYLNNNF